MTERHASTADLPGWDIADTVLDLNVRPRAKGWIELAYLDKVDQPVSALGRDGENSLFVASDGKLVDRPTHAAVNLSVIALLVGVDDGIAVWLNPRGYSHIKRINPAEPGVQPDVPHWIPIREVLPGIPERIRANLTD